MKRSRLRSVSRKRELQNIEYREVRDGWFRTLQETERWRCWWCGDWRRYAQDLHVEHMHHGQAKSNKARCEVCTFILVDPGCHREITGDGGVLPALLAIKKTVDPECYDRSKVLSLYWMADTAVTEEEVDEVELPGWIGKVNEEVKALWD